MRHFTIANHGNDNMGIAIGVDLGTTNSVSCIKKIEVSTILNSEGEALTPSCVTALPTHDNTVFDFIVGRASRDLLKQYPDQTITSIDFVSANSDPAPFLIAITAETL